MCLKLFPKFSLHDHLYVFMSYVCEKGRTNYYFYVTTEEMGSERLRNLPKVTQHTSRTKSFA